MKKSVVAVALVGVLGVTAHAATVSEFANGVLIPRVIDNGGGNATAIGLTSCAAGTVFWTFFDVDTKHVLDDQFDMTEDDQVGLVWNTTDNPGTDRLFGGQGVAGEEGYLVFILDTDGPDPESTTDRDGALSATTGNSDVPCLAGSAFQVNLTNDDVAFVPALPLDIRPIGAGDFIDDDDDGVYLPNLFDLDEVSVAGLNAGANGGDTLYMRYFLASAEDSTSIYIWSAQNLRGDYTVNIYDDNQARRSVNMRLDNAELNTVDPRTIIGRPSNFVDGFIKWHVPVCAGDQDGFGPTIGCPDGSDRDLVRGVVSWSVIDAPAFGAVQTIINPIRLIGTTTTLVDGNDRNDPLGFRVRVVESDGSVPGHSLEGASPSAAAE